MIGSIPKYRLEVALVLGLSLGQSAIYAIISLIANLTASGEYRDQSTTIVSPKSVRPLLDLTYQLAEIFFALLPVLLALYFLSQQRPKILQDIGADLSRPGKDFSWGLGLCALIGVPGLVFYLASRTAGLNINVEPVSIAPYWWAPVVLILVALKTAVIEEVIVVAYLARRGQDLGASTLGIVLFSSILRGSYHLYQGLGAFFGNFIMGVVFSLFFLKFSRGKRVLPLVIAHFIIDLVAFVGWAYAPQTWLKWLGL